MDNVKVVSSEKTIAYGAQRWKVDNAGNWQVLTFGKHGPNDPPVGLSYKWYPISSSKVPAEVKKLA